MALRDFWVSVRTAGKLVAPQVIADSPRLDAEAIERTLQGATLWLTPRAVAGFDVSDFGFLPDADRVRLEELVTQFREVASTVSPTAPASAGAVKKALPVFREIVQRLEFDRLGDAEANRLGKQIEHEIETYRPLELAELRFNTGLDHSGDPALWIWAFLTADASAEDERFLKAAQELRDMLDPVARRVSPDRWPYFSFRALAEQTEPVEAS